MKYPAIIYSQSSYKMISTVLPFKLVNSLSKTLIYGKDDGGYQRMQDEKHYLGIKKYIETSNYLFPNSIILAVDETDFQSILKDDSQDFVYLNFGHFESKIFRVVDGQHRLLGIESASISNSALLELRLQITIVLTPQNRRSMEMEIFSNINSKAKRLKIDLIELAKYDYRIIESKIGKADINPHIAINTAYYLNENNNDNNVWQNAIKIDIHSEHKIGIIGVKAFSESISGIVASYINNYAKEITALESKELIDFSRAASKDIGDFIFRAWLTVRKKWPNAFHEPYKAIDVDSQYRSIIYNPNFYIQKTLGCKSINYIISDLLRTEYNEKFSHEVLNQFDEIINASKLNDFDWLLGKSLSGISSESGFNKVSKIIRNQEEFIRRD